MRRRGSKGGWLAEKKMDDGCLLVAENLSGGTGEKALRGEEFAGLEHLEHVPAMRCTLCVCADSGRQLSKHRSLQVRVFWESSEVNPCRAPEPEPV